MAEPRDMHTATLLAGGRVLVVGGRSLFEDANGEVVSTSLASTTIYEPATNGWTAGPPLAEAREGHDAVRLPDGRVLVGGGFRAKADSQGWIGVDSLEVFDPATSRWSTIGVLPADHLWGTGTLLLDGRILVVGRARDSGRERELASIFDPTTTTWTPVARPDLVRAGHGTALLPDGRVLVVGGTIPGAEVPDAVTNAAVYDPVTNGWRDVGPMPISAFAPLVSVNPDGTVLVVRSGIEGTPTAVRFDPATATWTSAASAGDQPLEAWARLADGRLVAIDDHRGRTFLYDPATDAWRGVGTFKAVSLVPWVTLADGRVLSTGGYLNCADVNPCAEGEIAEAWVFDPDDAH